MTDVFLKLVNMSISASWIVIALLILRFAIKKAPRYISCILWGIVGVRLICPFSLKSILSVIPTSATASTAVTEEVVSIAPPVINQTINPIIVPDTNITVVAPETNIMDTVILIASIIWAVGTVLMLLYFVFNYIKIKHTARLGKPYGENIKLCDYISSPFVIGIIKPVICLPLNIEKEYIEYVIAHESAHIKRKDNIWKPLAFLILSVYWFNPLMWVSFVLLSKDIEFACDEKVIMEHGTNYKKPYSMALMNCSSTEDKTIVKLALGEISVKERILKIVDYKKPPLWITVIAIIVTVCMCVGFLTDPMDKANKDKKPDTVDMVVSEKEDITDTSSDLVESVVSTLEESNPAESKPKEEKEPTESKLTESKPTENILDNNYGKNEVIVPTPDVDNVKDQENNKKNVTFKSAQEVEAMTDEQIIEYYTNYNIVIPDFYSYDRLKIPYIEGEYLGAISPISASSVKEAIQKIEKFGFIEDSVSHNITFLGEDKYFYLFRITYSYGTVTHINRYFAYKENALHYSFDSRTGEYRKINMLDKDSVLNILDLEMSRMNRAIVFRQLEETETEYIYNYYAFKFVGGDWGLYDTVSLIKSFIKVDKKTGEYKFDTIYDRKVIKTVNIGDRHQLIIE